MDPWNSLQSIQLSSFCSCEFKLPPKSLDQLKEIHLLTKTSEINVEIEMALLFQYEDEIWSVSLRYPDK